MSNSKFFGIIVLNGNSQLVEYKEGAEETAAAILEYKNNFYTYLFTDKGEYSSFLAVYED